MQMIRNATEMDADAIASIYNYYIENTVVTFEESLVSAADMWARVEKVNRSGYPWLVAVLNDEIIGYAYASKWNERVAYRYTAETTVYLSHTSVSKGWGTKLYAAVFNELKQRSIHVVIGGVTLPNSASVALHEKFGMEKVAHFNAVGFKFDQWLDVGYWQVNL